LDSGWKAASIFGWLHGARIRVPSRAVRRRARNGGLEEALPSSLSSFKRRQPQLFSSSLLLSIMGVRGLTTYLRENRKSLTRSTKFETSQDPHQERVALVIDAWSLIYTLCFTLRWSYGGEHLEYARLLERVFSAFRAVGLEPVMVFDGTSRSSYVVLDSVDI
jgi:hypothetical protein